MLKKLAGFMTFSYFFLMLMVYPFWIKDGYVHIGSVKYQFFLYTGVAAMVVLIPLILLVHDRIVTYTDIMLLGYLLINVMSFAASSYRENAWLGATGWYMGLVTQVLLVFLYMAGENGILQKLPESFPGRLGNVLAPGGVPLVLWMGLLGATGVFLLGILHRFSIYPFPMTAANADYISTLGSINWYCGYWSVFALLGIGLFMIVESRIARVVLGVFCYLAILTGITQGSSSAGLVAIICGIVLIWKAFDSKKLLLRTIMLVGITGLAMQSVRQLFLYTPSGMQYDSAIVKYLMYHSIGFPVFAVMVVLWALGFFFLPSYENREALKAARVYIFAFGAAIAAVMFVVFLINTMVPGGIWPVRDIGFFYFSDMWGNGRGGIWKDTWMAFRKMSALQMLFGVGPDSYVEFIYEFPDITERIVNQFGSARLTNAHNELFNTVINTGLFGLIFYLGTFATAIRSFVKNMPKNPVLFALMLSLLGYLMNNLVSFPQVLSTPFVFLMMGVGEGLTKQLDSPNMISIRKRNEED